MRRPSYRSPALSSTEKCETLPPQRQLLATALLLALAAAPEEEAADRHDPDHGRRLLAVGRVAAPGATAARARVGRRAGVERPGHGELLLDRGPVQRLAGVVLHG